MQNETIKIILADDDEDDRLFFIEAFEELRMKTEVTTVNDGNALMKKLDCSAEQLPHILFLDLNMPFKNGMECLKEIKNNPLLKNIAIAIYSTSSADTDVENTFVQGANVYIKKPSDFDQLKKILSVVVTTNWQYQTSGLDRSHFILSL